jgi:ABC-type nitrate/sulfonate/bicarbonate transport system substrate-binding protein
VRFLRALVMAYGVLQKDPTLGVRLLADQMGIQKAWAETIYREAPPPRIYEWANPRYDYMLAKGLPFHRRLGDLAAFLLAEKVIPTPVDVSEATDASVMTEASVAWEKSP